MAPLIFPWGDCDFYPSLYGHTYVNNVVFAKFGTPCSSGPRNGKVDRVFITNPESPDATHPMTVSNITLQQVRVGLRKSELEFSPVQKIMPSHLTGALSQVADKSLFEIAPPNKGWINQADCIDMDCDGPKCVFCVIFFEKHISNLIFCVVLFVSTSFVV